MRGAMVVARRQRLLLLVVSLSLSLSLLGRGPFGGEVFLSFLVVFHEEGKEAWRKAGKEAKKWRGQGIFCFSPPSISCVVLSAFPYILIRFPPLSTLFCSLPPLFFCLTSCVFFPLELRDLICVCWQWSLWRVQTHRLGLADFNWHCRWNAMLVHCIPQLLCLCILCQRLWVRRFGLRETWGRLHCGHFRPPFLFALAVVILAIHWRLCCRLTCRCIRCCRALALPIFLYRRRSLVICLEANTWTSMPWPTSTPTSTTSEIWTLSDFTRNSGPCPTVCNMKAKTFVFAGDVIGRFRRTTVLFSFLPANAADEFIAARSAINLLLDWSRGRCRYWVLSHKGVVRKPVRWPNAEKSSHGCRSSWRFLDDDPEEQVVHGEDMNRPDDQTQSRLAHNLRSQTNQYSIHPRTVGTGPFSNQFHFRRTLHWRRWGTFEGAKVVVRKNGSLALFAASWPGTLPSLFLGCWPSLSHLSCGWRQLAPFLWVVAVPLSTSPWMVSAFPLLPWGGGLPSLPPLLSFGWSSLSLGYPTPFVGGLPSSFGVACGWRWCTPFPLWVETKRSPYCVSLPGRSKVCFWTVILVFVIDIRRSACSNTSLPPSSPSPPPSSLPPTPSQHPLSSPDGLSLPSMAKGTFGLESAQPQHHHARISLAQYSIVSWSRTLAMDFARLGVSPSTFAWAWDSVTWTVLTSIGKWHE